MQLRALRGFYNQKSGARSLDPISKWLFASRSVILIISVQAAIIAGILSFTYARFNLFYFMLVLIGFVIAHAASNLMNDYFGYTRGHDKSSSPRRAYTLHPIASGLVTEAELRNAIIALVIAGLIIASYFAYIRGYAVIVLLAIGAFFLFGYDALPVTLKSMGLGEISAFIVWGPLMVGGGYYVITGIMSMSAFLAGVPYGFGVMSILTGKHIDQMDFDKKERQHTLPVLLGESNARALNVLIIAAMYISVLIMSYGGIISVFSLIILLNFPNAAQSIALLSKKRPKTQPRGYAGWPLWYHRTSLGHNEKFGWLYIIGLMFGAAASVLH